ncbi:hypothetical protein ACFULT_26210 [Rhodococcus sp. NPDC057297]|uniref:hypothetical protein n=1 Tax=Rhodococcus sp. NPDC057297 TaxID=3346090 RepID=UPI00363C8C11
MEPLYRRGDRWIELAPNTCTEGHPLTPGNVLVGSYVCNGPCGHHRTHRCRHCDDVTYTPALTRECTRNDGGRSTFTWMT